MRSSFLPRLMLLALLVVAIPLIGQSLPSPYDAVDPLIGSSGDGQTFPGATLPFGMMQWSPSTNEIASYLYPQKQIYGFGLTHISGAGCPLYGDFAVLPVAGALASSPGSGIAPYALNFDHAKEEAHPGYYSVTLENGVRVELTVDERAGIARFTFPQGVPARLLVNAGSSANSFKAPAANDPDQHPYRNEIALEGGDSYRGSASAGAFCWGHSHYTIYAAGQFNKPYKATAVWQDERVSATAKAAKGTRTGAMLDFGDQREVELKVGISFVSEAGALTNRNKEIAGWDFEGVRTKAASTWSRLLGRLAVDGGTKEQRTIFYTGVYHSFLSPNLFSDEDGRYIGFDHTIHSLAGSKQTAQYANFSDWDIYRNTVQFQALFEPARESDMMQSLVNDAVESGWYPRWPAANEATYIMEGDSPVLVIASAYAFGAKEFDTTTALKYMIKAGMDAGSDPHGNPERSDLASYLKVGYVPVDKDIAAASRTLEYANADFAVAQFAKSVGDESHYQSWMKRSESWKSLFNPEIGWIEPRMSDGSWLPGFDAEKGMPVGLRNHYQRGFGEGNTYQYSFMLPFDFPSLFAAMGGEEKVIARLDGFFVSLRCHGQEPCYTIENEPDFVSPFAYTFAGQPWKTQKVLARVGRETFKMTPDGIPGNDDLGATSGVYVWDALGLYPAVPGVDGLVLGTPLFDKVTLQLAGNRNVVINRQGSGDYVTAFTLDGQAYSSTWLPLAKLHAGTTTLGFSVSDSPHRQRGSAIGDRPPSFR